MNEKGARLLSLYADNAREIERLEAELKQWEARSIETKALEKLLRKRLNTAVEQRMAAETSIAAVENATLRALLEYRYIHCLTWERVGDVMCYDTRWLHRLHKRALEALPTA